MPKILVVDDAAVERLLAANFLRDDPEIELVYAANGREALVAIERELPDLVLTDLQMPEMDGLQLVEQVRKKYRLLPVILMTAHGSEDIAIQALQKGAASYVAKRNLGPDLLETVQDILAASSAAKDQQRVLGCLTHTESQFIIDNNDQSLITPLYGYLETDLRRLGACDSNEYTRVAVALREAMINAIYHGNLEVGSELRESDPKGYYQLLEERRRRSPYRERLVHVTARITPASATFIIRDEGPGFDPSTLPDPTDPACLEKPSGRGILLIRTFMDEVSHNATGNEITMVKRRRQEPGAPPP
jgi:CheY-like chemotaxis protein/anti-sigma regulatory factor (Ser/Thr protein kinase)